MKNNLVQAFCVVFLLVVMAFYMTGCKSLSHVDELLLLKRFSSEQAEIASEVEASDQGFEKLVKTVEAGNLLQYENQFQIKAAFGAPVLTETVTKDDQVFSRWLYRYSTRFFDSPKVYLYFDDSGVLSSWDYVQ